MDHGKDPPVLFQHGDPALKDLTRMNIVPVVFRLELRIFSEALLKQRDGSPELAFLKKPDQSELLSFPCSCNSILDHFPGAVDECRRVFGL